MGAITSTVPLVLAALGAGLAVVGFLLVILAGQRRARTFEEELDRLHDEVWELREAAAARDRAEAANEAKSRFLASVSHEVRTPLNGILGMAELLDGSRLDAEQQTYVAAIRSSGSALASLIDEILDLAKIEAGKVELADDRFDLIALVEGVVELLAPRAQGKSLEIAATLAADVPRHVVGDPVRLRQILLNIAGNAVKFTERGGIGLRVVCADAGQIQIEIVDTGPGVPADKRAAIFEDFEQAGDDVTRRHGGTGLGLAISKRLAERMGGSLTLEPTPPGEGSRFSIELPLPAADAPSIEASPQTRLDGRRVLIAADAPFEAQFLRERLEEAGASVIRVDGLDDGLDRLAAEAPFDLVLVDCALGDDATRALGEGARAAGAGKLIVLFSPYERRSFGQPTAQGFDGWLVKPVRKRSLFALIGADKPASVVAPTTLDAPLGRLSVLLAEDNEINALLATRHLQRLGATVTHAPDGLTALTLAETALDAGTPFDAMVLDVRMPGLDGIELARRIRLAESAHQGRPSRLIALSADLVDAERRSASLAGIDECLGKPISFARLERALGHVAAAS